MDSDIEGDTTGPATGRMSDRRASVQIVGRVSGRRTWTVEQKLAIIGEAFSPGSSVAQTVERHEISTGQLYTWRRQLLDGQLGGPRDEGRLRTAPTFARVEIAPVREAARAIAAPQPAQLATAESASDAQDGPTAMRVSGPIEIELVSGVRVRVLGGVEGETLKRVLYALGWR